jgi:hypothetical protein
VTSQLATNAIRGDPREIIFHDQFAQNIVFKELIGLELPRVPAKS